MYRKELLSTEAKRLLIEGFQKAVKDERIFFSIKYTDLPEEFILFNEYRINLNDESLFE